MRELKLNNHRYGRVDGQTVRIFEAYWYNEKVENQEHRNQYIGTFHAPYRTSDDDLKHFVPKV